MDSVIAYVIECGGRWGEIAKRVPMVIDDVNYCTSNFNILPALIN